MDRTTGYSISSYGDMIADSPRMHAYIQALQQAMQPGCTVLDIGTGTGIFSLLACQFGADHVHAIEPAEAIEVAKAIAAVNGYTSRITFHQALSNDVTLSKLADIIISDLRGVLPLFQHHISIIADGRKRLLSANGCMIPKTDTIWAAFVDSPLTYRHYADPWLDNEYGLNMRAGQELVVNTWRKVNLKLEQLVVNPQRWATLDYATIQDPNVAGELTWNIGPTCTIHGLVLWFDAELGDGIGFSNAPGQPELIYGQAFFPLQKPVTVEIGDRITVYLRADLVGDDYVWQWRTCVYPAGETQLPRISFEQSTFFGEIVSPSELRRQEAGYVPSLDIKGQVDSFLLANMDGRGSLEEIARLAARQFPEHFTSWRDALTARGSWL